MKHSIIILRYANGAVGLTGWGYVVMLTAFVLIAIAVTLNRAER